MKIPTKSALKRTMFVAATTVGLLPIGAACQTALSPKTMPKIGEVDPRFLSYNVEAVEVTGGRFWKPYDAEVDARLAAASQGKRDANQPVGMDPSLFQYRAPIDLGNARLRKLASALAPAYIRVSGTWRNTTFFQDDDRPALQTPPKGFNGVLTRAQWKGVVDFAAATGSDIVTSVAISAGTRDAAGVWTPDQAKAVFDYTRSVGGHIAATEFMNEPTFAGIGGAPKGYDAGAFAKDVKVFTTFLRSESSGTVFLGPGGVGEGYPMAPGTGQMSTLTTEDMLKQTGPVFDAFSYHFYGTISRRCTASLGPGAGTTSDRALTPDWLGRNVTVEEFYAKLRDAYVPGKAMWLTETAEAACGGDKWAATFVDSFRFLDQLGTLAQRSVKTVMHNTLAASDYGLLDEKALEPRPNFWAALLWKRTMGTQVLSPGVPTSPTLSVFAHCLKGSKGGVAVLVLNLDQKTEQSFQLPMNGELYTLSAPDLLSSTVSLNGVELKAAADGTVPAIQGQAMKAGPVRLAPLTLNFITFANAKNANCMR